MANKKKKRKEENKTILKQWVRLFFIIAVIAVMGASILCIVKALKPEQVTRKKLYSYNYNTSLDYRVYLKNNNFFTEPYMDMNKQYIASLIDYIEVDTKYDFRSTEDLDYSYSYAIEATARGMFEDSDGRKVDVWSKTYPISTLESNSGSGRNFNIAKTVKIDYNYFNQVLSDFRSQFGLSVDSRVDLTFIVNVNAGLHGDSEKTLQESKKMNLLIPLLVQTVRIQPDYVNTGGNTIYSKVNEAPEINVALLVIGAVVFIISFIVFIKLVKSLLVVTRKSEYMIAVDKILKEYGDIIAETHNMPDLDKYDIVDIKTFDDMVDIEEELHSPIIYFETLENEKCVFLILHDKTAYRFLLMETDFNHFVNTNDNHKRK